MTRNGSPRTGVSLTEIMIVVLLIAFALIPLMNLGRSTHRQAFFAEHHLLAMGRARLILDLAATVDFEIYDALANKAGTPEAKVDLEALLGPGVLATLYSISGKDLAKNKDLTGLAYQDKLKNFTHDVRFNRLDKESGRLDVVVNWAYAGDGRGADHSVKLSRLVTRRELGVTHRYAFQ